MEDVLTPDARDFLSQWHAPTHYVVAHTSGSTGTPKEIRLLKSDMKASALATNRFFGITDKSTLCLPLSPDYIAGKMMLVRAAETGARIIVETPSRHPGASIPEGSEIDLLAIVPAQIPGLLEQAPRLRFHNVIIGGAPIAPDDEKRLLDARIPAFATYGMTETCSHVALRRIGTPSFEALPGFRFSADSRGCLVIETDTMSFRRLVTNDIVTFHSDTSFTWLGRFDNVVNSGGIKLFPETLERRLRHLDPGLEFYLTSRQSPRWGEELVMVVAESDAIRGNRLLAVASEILPTRQRPKALVTIPEIPHTSTGKLLRHRF